MKSILSIAVILALTGCSKNSDTTKPNIVIQSPQNQQTFANGQTVTVAATISDESELHGVHITVINTTNGGHIVHEEYHPDATTYNLSKTFTAQAGGVYKIEIGAEDHNSNSAMTELQVRTQ